MTTIFALSGSLRAESLNTKLLKQAVKLAPPGVTFQIGSIAGVPLYDQDVQDKGIPESVQRLKDACASADGILLATPEYNHSIPGVLKNAIDWMSRPPSDIDRVFDDKPVGLIGASPGAGGTRFSQIAWMPVLHALGLRFYTGDFFVLGHAHKAFDAEGNLTDEKTKAFLAEYVAGLAKWAEKR